MLKFGFDFYWVALISTLIDFIVASMILFWPSRQTTDPHSTTKELTLARFTSAFICTTVIFIFKLIILTASGVHLFGWIRLVYFACVIVFPALGLMILLSRLVPGRMRCKPVGGVSVIAFLLLLGAPVGIYASLVEPFRLQLENPVVRSDSESESRRPIRIGILADIQTNEITNFERSAINRLADESPDIVILPGDLFQGTRQAFDAQTPAMAEMLNSIDPAGGLFFVTGDVDHEARLRPLFGKTKVRLIDQEIVEVNVGDRTLIIGGVPLDYASAASKRTIERLTSMPKGDRVKILVAHRPDVVSLLAPKSDIDVVIAGHTHGGQIVIPGFGPPMTLSGLSRNVAAGGLHEVNGNRIYISRGVGCERGQAPRIRFLCPPEITLLTIE